MGLYHWLLSPTHFTNLSWKCLASMIDQKLMSVTLPMAENCKWGMDWSGGFTFAHCLQCTEWCGVAVFSPIDSIPYLMIVVITPR